MNEFENLSQDIKNIEKREESPFLIEEDSDRKVWNKLTVTKCNLLFPLIIILTTLFLMTFSGKGHICPGRH